MTNMTKTMSMTGEKSRVNKQVAKAIAPMNKMPPAKAMAAAHGSPKPTGGVASTPNKSFLKDTSRFEKLNGAVRGKADGVDQSAHMAGPKGHLSYTGKNGKDRG